MLTSQSHKVDLLIEVIVSNIWMKYKKLVEKPIQHTSRCAPLLEIQF